MVRFPLPLLAALIGVTAVIIETHDDRWILVSILALPILIASSLYSEREDPASPLRFLVSALPLPFLVAYFISLPDRATDIVVGIRYTLLMISSILLMLAAPFLPPRTTVAFHRFATGFLLRMLLTTLFTLLLYGGLALALAAIDKLFGVDIDGEVYGKLFAVLVGFVALPYLLSGVPRDHDVEASDVPKGLRVLTQYVFIPILIVYALILYAHAARQIATWEWSEGWVARLVLGYAASGLLAFAILWPQRDDPDNGWIRGFARWFALLLPPLALLLFLAVFRRVDEYGLTESRYYGFVVAVWLAAVALYLLISRRSDIRLLALSLAVIALGTVYGPWSATSLSVTSQIAQLERHLVARGILKNGLFVSTPPPLPNDQRNISYSVVGFLADRHALEELRPWFAQAPDTITQSDLMVAMGEWDANAHDDVAPMPAIENRVTIMREGEEPEGVNIAGYDLYVSIPNASGFSSHRLSGDSLTARFDNGSVRLFRSGQAILSVDLLSRLRAIYREKGETVQGRGDKASESGETIVIGPESRNRLVVDAADTVSGYALRVVMEGATIVVDGESVSVRSFSGYMLMRMPGD